MIYIHVPFCRSFCIYCDFFSELCHKRDEEKLFSDWSDAIRQEAKARTEEIRASIMAGAPDSIYIGGGTPSLLPISVLKGVIEALPAGAGNEEFTIEVNPDDILRKGRDYVAALREIGVGRVSMGVQSFDDGILRWMRRRHDRNGAFEAYNILQGSGVENISIDLMFGIPDLSDKMWSESIDCALGLRPEHISAYQLSIEDGSDLAKLIATGKIAEALEEQCRRQYELLCERLSSAGYHHYEISNWALPGFEAVHNSAYWKRLPYVGLGAGAHSFRYSNGQEIRSWNSEDIADYTSSSEVLSKDEIREEKIMLGLRTARGIAPQLLDPTIVKNALETGELEYVHDTDDFSTMAEPIRTDELISAYKTTNVRIPENKLFVSDDIITRLTL